MLRSVNHQVRWLQVAVDDPSVMGVLHRLGGIDHYPGDRTEVFGREHEIAIAIAVTGSGRRRHVTGWAFSPRRFDLRPCGRG